MRIVEYDYKPEFASSMGINTAHQTGMPTNSLFNFVLSTHESLIPSLSGGYVLWHWFALWNPQSLEWERLEKFLCHFYSTPPSLLLHPTVLVEYFEYVVSFHWCRLAHGMRAQGQMAAPTVGGAALGRPGRGEGGRVGGSRSEKGQSGVYTPIQES